MADCRRFSGWMYRRTPDRPQVLLLCGPSGTGKTHLARSIYGWWEHTKFSAGDAAFWPKGPTSYWCNWPEVVTAFKGGSEYSFHDAMDASVSFVDDIGAEDRSFGIAADRLCQLLTRREGMHWFTVLTTNVSSDNLRQVFDSRVHSRVMRAGLVLDFADVKPYEMV